MAPKEVLVLMPRTCESDLTRQRALCSSDEVKDLEMGR